MLYNINHLEYITDSIVIGIRRVKNMSTNTTAAPAAKGKKKSGGVFFTIIVVLALLGGGYYLVTNFLLAPKHEIRIEDKVIGTDSTIQAFLDDGFVLCDVTGRIFDPSGYTLDAKEICNDSFYLGVDPSTYSAKCSGVQITPANFSTGSQSLTECSVFEIKYSPKFQDAGVTVLVDGTDMNTVALDQWVSFLKEKSFPFSAKDFDELSTGASTFASATKETHKYSVDLDFESKADASNNLVYEYSFGSLSIARNVQVEYKTN